MSHGCRRISHVTSCRVLGHVMLHRRTAPAITRLLGASDRKQQVQQKDTGLGPKLLSIYTLRTWMTGLLRVVRLGKQVHTPTHTRTPWACAEVNAWQLVHKSCSKTAVWHISGLRRSSTHTSTGLQSCQQHHSKALTQAQHTKLQLSTHTQLQQGLHAASSGTNNQLLFAGALLQACVRQAVLAGEGAPHWRCNVSHTTQDGSDT
jgi:hypothetical protein